MHLRQGTRYARSEGLLQGLLPRRAASSSGSIGQMATWVHNETPDMDYPSNWLKKVHDHTGVMPAYGCLTYDFDDDPFSDAQWCSPSIINPLSTTSDR